MHISKHPPSCHWVISSNSEALTARLKGATAEIIFKTHFLKKVDEGLTLEFIDDTRILDVPASCRLKYLEKHSRLLYIETQGFI